MKKLAILDDFERAAKVSAQWDRLAGKVDVQVFHDHLSDERAVAARLADFEMVFIMRESPPWVLVAKTAGSDMVFGWVQRRRLGQL